MIGFCSLLSSQNDLQKKEQMRKTWVEVVKMERYYQNKDKIGKNLYAMQLEVWLKDIGLEGSRECVAV